MDLRLALSLGAVALEAAVTALAVLVTVLDLPAAALEVLVSPVAVRLWLSLLVVKVLELAQLSPTMVRPKLKHAQLFMRMSALL